MNYIAITLLAYLLNSIAILIDRFLLKKQFKDPIIYIFYITLFSLVILVLLPFALVPSQISFILASVSSLSAFAAGYYLYKAIKLGVVSRVVPMIGVLSPIFLLIYTYFFVPVTILQIQAVILLILGLIMLTIFDWKGSMTKTELTAIFLSALFFSISTELLHQAYIREGSVITVLVWSRMILIPLLLLLAIQKKIRTSLALREKNGLSMPVYGMAIFVTGQALGGAAQLFLQIAISMTNTVFVNALQGFQYGIIFLASMALSFKFPNIFAESTKAYVLAVKAFGIFVLGIGIYLLVLETAG